VNKEKFMSVTKDKFKASQLSISLVPGDVAPRYLPISKELVIQKAVITEKGTEGNLPLVDLVLKDDDGNEFYTMVTGRIILGLAAAIKGVNLRNHGTEEP
jgi:hypothetical protein